MYTLTKIVQNQQPNARAYTWACVQVRIVGGVRWASVGLSGESGGGLMHFSKCKPPNLQQTSETTD